MDFEKQMEFLLQNQASHDAKIGILLGNQAAHDAKISVLLDMQKKNELLMADLITAVMSHERRISGLEGHN